MESSTPLPVAEPAAEPISESPANPAPMPKNLGVALLALLFILPLILAFVQLMRRQQQGDEGEILLATPAEEPPATA